MDWASKAAEVYNRLEAEGLNPEDFHNLGIARDLAKGEDWAAAKVLNKWIGVLA